MKQFLRCGLAFTFSGVVGTSIATDALLGVGDRVTAKTNIGALKKGYVNIAVHGHLPVLVREIVKTGYSEAFQKLAEEKGAKGIQFYGICCSGLSAMYRYAGVIPLSNAVSAELVLGTGALDLWVADVQEVYPSIMDVARCYKTVVVTTSDSARLPGAEHIGYDHHHSNIEETRKIAEKIVTRAIESFEQRKGMPVFIPPYEVEAEVGFSVEYVHKHFGSMKPLAEALVRGDILGIVNMVGCNNPKVLYEKAILDVADVLLKNNVVMLINMFGGKSVDFIDGPYWAKMFVLCFYTIWVVLPFKILILTSALSSVNQEYYNAARVDGTSAFRIFRRITLPMISPMIFYLVITGFIGAFKAYSDAVALFGTNLNAAEMNTIVGYVYDMLYGDSGGYPSYASAAAIILFAIVLTITSINLLVNRRQKIGLL